MKITCDREKLLAAFQTAAMVAPSRSPKAILQNVKVVADPERTILTATDMEVGIQIEVEDITVDVPGMALLSVAGFGSILRENTDERLRIEADGSGIQVFGDRSNFRILSGDPNSFPAVNEFTETAYHEVSARLMKELIRRTLFATDAESSRYALGGVLLEMEPEHITAVATDGRRLSKMEGAATSVDGHDNRDITTIIPSKSMHLIDRSLVDLDETIKITASQGNDILVQTRLATISSRLVEGRFPRWRDVLPDRSESGISIDMTVGPLYSALRQASIVSSSESRGIDFVFGNGSLIMTGVTADVGESHVELPINYDGEPINMCLDYRYVGDFLRVLDVERTFTLNIVDGDNAALFQTDDGYGYVVMPLARDKPEPAEAAASAS